MGPYSLVLQSWACGDFCCCDDLIPVIPVVRVIEERQQILTGFFNQKLFTLWTLIRQVHDHDYGDHFGDDQYDSGSSLLPCRVQLSPPGPLFGLVFGITWSPSSDIPFHAIGQGDV
ncbi:UNVERIFIED_CONTAM: hypothetical protein K2H54_002337 [Gekko kuhli]